MKANTEIKKQVLATLERFNAAVAGRDLHASLSFFVKDADVCLIYCPPCSLLPDGLAASDFSL